MSRATASSASIAPRLGLGARARRWVLRAGLLVARTRPPMATSWTPLAIAAAHALLSLFFLGAGWALFHWLVAEPPMTWVRHPLRAFELCPASADPFMVVFAFVGSAPAPILASTSALWLLTWASGRVDGERAAEALAALEGSARARAEADELSIQLPAAPRSKRPAARL